MPAVLLSVSLPAEGGHVDWLAARFYAFPPINILPLVLCMIREGGCFGDTHCHELAKPALVPGPDRASGGAALADPHQEGSAISGERFGVAPEPGVVEPSCLATSGISEELSALHSCVLDLLSEAQAPSLVCSEMGNVCEMVLYVHINPATCSVSDVLRILQYRLDSGSLPSTLKVYVGAIASFRSLLGRQSISRHALVVSFLKGVKRFQRPRPPLDPP